MDINIPIKLYHIQKKKKVTIYFALSGLISLTSPTLQPHSIQLGIKKAKFVH